MGTTRRRSNLAGVVALACVVAVPLLGQAVRTRGFQPGSAPAAGGQRVTQADVERWKQELTNWGRWGADDERGTLNLITPEKRRQAAALVREGISVSLARDAETEATVDGPRPYQVIPLGTTASRSIPSRSPCRCAARMAMAACSTSRAPRLAAPFFAAMRPRASAHRPRSTAEALPCTLRARDGVGNRRLQDSAGPAGYAGQRVARFAIARESSSQSRRYFPYPRSR